jgi:glutaredoxin
VSVIIYSRDDCPWCVRAKDMLYSIGKEYEEIKIGRDLTREEFKEQFPEVKTVPYIIIDGNVIGGYENLLSHYKLL